MASWLENSASTYTPVGASLFVLCTIESAAWKPQKSRRATDNFSCRAGVPFREEVFGDKGEEQHRLHCLFDTQRLSSTKTARMGDKAKALVPAGAFADLTKETALTEKGQVNNGRGDKPNRHDILTGSQSWHRFPARQGHDVQELDE